MYLTLGMLSADCHHAAFCYAAQSIPARPLQHNTVNEKALLQVEKPREDYIMVIDADSILRKPFLPEELHLELGVLSGPALWHSWKVAGLHLWWHKKAEIPEHALQARRTRHTTLRSWLE